MSNFVNIRQSYPDNKNHWYNMVVDTQDDKYMILKFARSINAEYCVSAFYDKYMIELYMDEMQREEMNKFISSHFK